MTLECINFWFIVLRVSISYSFYPMTDLETRRFHPPPKIKQCPLNKFIFWAMKSFFETFRKIKYKSFLVQKFWSAWYKICSWPTRLSNSSSRYTNFWPYIVPPRVEPHCQLPSLFVHWFYWGRNTHAMLYKCGYIRRLKHGKSFFPFFYFLFLFSIKSMTQAYGAIYFLNKSLTNCSLTHPVISVNNSISFVLLIQNR